MGHLVPIVSNQTALSLPATPVATKATSDQQLLESWVASLTSGHSKRNFEITAQRFMSMLGCGIREAAVEDVRQALQAITADRAASTVRQYTLRVKAFLSYAHKLGYTVFNAGVVIRAPKADRALIKRIVGELDVRDMIRAGRSPRDRLIATVFYAGGLRVSELVALSCGDVITQANGRVQLHVVGKGDKAREVLLPPSVGEKVRSFSDGRPAGAPLFATKDGTRLSARTVRECIKKLARRARVNPKVSPHWLRHAHASHALDHGESLAVVAQTLGHESVSTTSGYLHAKPGVASGDKLNPDVWNDGK